MFKPQGGSLHTDENMTMHVRRFCCMIPGLGEKNQSLRQPALREESPGPGWMQTHVQTQKTHNPDIVSTHGRRLTVHKPQHVLVKFTFT